MADRRDAQLTEIRARKPAQHLAVNVVGAECGQILLEPEPAQPFGYIHRSCLTPATRGPLQPPCGILSRVTQSSLDSQQLATRAAATSPCMGAHIVIAIWRGSDEDDRGD